MRYQGAYLKGSALKGTFSTFLGLVGTTGGYLRMGVKILKEYIYLFLSFIGELLTMAVF